MRVSQLNLQTTNNKTSFKMRITPGKGFSYIPDDIIDILLKHNEVIRKAEPVNKNLFAMIPSEDHMDYFDLELQSELNGNSIIHKTVSDNMYTQNREEIEKSLLEKIQEISNEYIELIKKDKNSL